MLPLSELERDILSRYNERLGDVGFPPVESMQVFERDDWGGGRFTTILAAHSLKTVGEQLGLGRYSQFDMAGLPYGASFALYPQPDRLRLEIWVNGDSRWDGVERAWIILDPETGDLPT